MKLSKVEMCFPEISFLGHQIKHGSVTTDDNIVSKILKIEPPKTKKHVQALLGLINYSKFIPCFAEKTAVLSSLLKKEVRKIVWTNQCQKILDEIKVFIFILSHFEDPRFQRDILRKTFPDSKRQPAVENNHIRCAQEYQDSKITH